MRHHGTGELHAEAVRTIERDGSTIIPIVSFGFGFGAGGMQDQKTGNRGGTGGGGGIKPLGAIIIDKDGARVEGVKGAVSSMAEILGEAANKAIEASAKKSGGD